MSARLWTSGWDFFHPTSEFFGGTFSLSDAILVDFAGQVWQGLHKLSQDSCLSKAKLSHISRSIKQHALKRIGCAGV